MNDFWQWITAFVAIATLVIAVRQWLISKDTLRLDLFEKRHRVYAATKSFLSIPVGTPGPGQEDLNEFKKDTADALFLFGADVVAYLKAVNDKGARLLYIRRRTEHPENLPMLDPEPYAGPLTPAQRDELNASQREINIWVGDQLTKGALVEVFAPYLKFPDKAPGVVSTLALHIVLACALAGAAFYIGTRTTQSPDPAPAVTDQTQQKSVPQPPDPSRTLPPDDIGQAPAGSASETAATPSQPPGATAPAADKPSS